MDIPGDIHGNDFQTSIFQKSNSKPNKQTQDCTFLGNEPTY